MSKMHLILEMEHPKAVAPKLMRLRLMHFPRELYAWKRANEPWGAIEVLALHVA